MAMATQQPTAARLSSHCACDTDKPNGRSEATTPVWLTGVCASCGGRSRMRNASKAMPMPQNNPMQM